MRNDLDGKTYAFDLDGVLAHYKGWRGPQHIGCPVLSMSQLLTDLRERGAKILIFTSRGSVDTQAWADYHGIPYDYINSRTDVYTQNPGKPLYDVYIGDRCVCFSGDVAKLREDLETFVPWTGTK